MVVVVLRAAAVLLHNDIPTCSWTGGLLFVFVSVVIRFPFCDLSRGANVQ